MAWKFESDIPVSKQLAQIIRVKILLGEYKKGSQFPTVRALAQEAGVNPNTVQKAIFYLEDDGILVTKRTAGRFVTDDEETLTQILQDVQKSYVKKVMTDAKALGITKEIFLKYLSSEEEIK